MTDTTEKPLGFETLALHAGQTVDSDTGSRAVPLYQTTSFLFKDAGHAARLFGLQEFGNIYTRIMNPTTDVFEKRVAALEGGVAAVAFASGQAAETATILNLATSGDDIVSTTSLYGGTYSLFQYTLPKMGINVIFCEPTPEAVAAVITPKTKAVYSETVGNPNLITLDIEGVAKVAHDNGVPLIIDNTMPSPYLVNPIKHGADIVIHSATKFLSGHGTSIAGVAVDGGNFDWAASGKFPEFTEPDASYHGLKFWETFGPITFAIKLRVSVLRDTGGALSPFNAWNILQGIETLPVRMDRHSENAAAVARFLQEHPKVEWVNYPGLATSPSYAQAAKYHYRGKFGAMLGFGVKGGREAGQKFIESVKLFSHLANIGDSKSLVIHPASTTHSQLTDEELAMTGATPDYIRVSVGIETASDLIDDLDQALCHI
jgi:O-acetylhomoserine (thiol)-lyase